MKDVTRLYDGSGCNGFVKRQDGYWWIRDGSLTSMSQDDGKHIEKLLHTIFLNQRTPNFADAMKHISAMWKHRVACSLYEIARKLG